MSLLISLRHAMRTPAFKFVVVAILVLALSIPLLFVFLMVSEREQYARKAQSDIGSKWGLAQTVRGPFVIVPTLKKQEIKRGSETRIETVRRIAVFLPEALNIAANAQTEIRKRGIFEVPVYRGTIRFSGVFAAPELAHINRSVDEIVWAEAALAVMIDDVRPIKKAAEINLGGAQESRVFRSGPGISAQGVSGIHVPLTGTEAQGRLSFAFELALNGSSRLSFVPAGRETKAEIKSDWPHPSFDGAFLPDRRQIGADGFRGEWAIPSIARGHGQAFLTANMKRLMHDTVFGVSFYQPVEFYNLVERSLKYALGFIAVAFFAVFVMEIHTARHVHWIQYIFVGLALIIFYLVLLGTSEHLGFELSYSIASVSTSVLIGTYVASALGSFRRGSVIFCAIGLIYGLLYLLLRVEDYAMLIGSVAAFLSLAVVMYATRNVDWSADRSTQNADVEAR